MKFSKTTGCFYPDDIHYPNPPDDLDNISEEDYVLAMSRVPGETLDVVSGRIIIVPVPAPVPAEVQADTKRDSKHPLSDAG